MDAQKEKTVQKVSLKGEKEQNWLILAGITGGTD